jgi:tRNA(Leu) C34 or U34 (ribose-2'-O)-methylase TrmL
VKPRNLDLKEKFAENSS